MDKSQQFILAFWNHSYPIDRLAALLGSVVRLDPQGRFCTMTDGDETLAVSDHYCAFCNAIHGNPADGEGPCIHKAVLSLAYRAQMAWREEAAFGEDDAADQYETYRDALDVGVQ